MKKIVGLTVVVFALVVFVPSADARVRISKNGTRSTNMVSMMRARMQASMQLNTANVNNSVVITSNTGENTASGNTGAGDVNVTSGKTEAGVVVTNTVNTNEAKLEGCGCETEETDVTISENGKETENSVMVAEVDAQENGQENEAKVTNEVEVETTTGDNEAKNNTGDGMVKVMSGMSSTMLDLMTTANYNWTVIK